MGICRNCRFWEEATLFYERELGYGDCTAIPCESTLYQDSPIAVVNLISETGFAELLTKADFGCILFEEQTMKRDIAQELRDDLEALQRGDKMVTTIRTVEIPSSVVIRQSLGLSQAEFSQVLGISLRTLQEWEQGRSIPSGPALSLLRIIEKHPEVLDD